MSYESGGLATELRRIFAAAPGEEINMQTLYERMGVAGIGQAQERKNIRGNLPSLVRGGFLVKSGQGPDATYKATGAGMKRPTATAEGRASSASQGRSRAERVGMQAANTPKPFRVAYLQSGETVEQFEARGGRVEVLPTFWDRAA